MGGSCRFLCGCRVCGNHHTLHATPAAGACFCRECCAAYRGGSQGNSPIALRQERKFRHTPLQPGNYTAGSGNRKLVRDNALQMRLIAAVQLGERSMLAGHRHVEIDAHILGMHAWIHCVLQLRILFIDQTFCLPPVLLLASCRALQSAARSSCCVPAGLPEQPCCTFCWDQR